MTAFFIRRFSENVRVHFGARLSCIRSTQHCFLLQWTSPAVLSRSQLRINVSHSDWQANVLPTLSGRRRRSDASCPPRGDQQPLTRTSSHASSIPPSHQLCSRSSSPLLFSGTVLQPDSMGNLARSWPRSYVYRFHLFGLASRVKRVPNTVSRESWTSDHSF